MTFLIASFSVSFNAHFFFLFYLYNYLTLGFDNLSPFGFYDTDSPGFLHVSFAYFYFVQSLNIFQDFDLKFAEPKRPFSPPVSTDTYKLIIPWSTT